MSDTNRLNAKANKSLLQSVQQVLTEAKGPIDRKKEASNPPAGHDLLPREKGSLDRKNMTSNPPAGHDLLSTVSRKIRYRVDRNHPYYYPNEIQHSPEAHEAAAAFHENMVGVLEDSIAYISKPENENPNKRSQDRHLEFLKNAKKAHEAAMEKHLAKAGK